LMACYGTRRRELLMRKLILMVGLIVVGVACGDAVSEMLDAGVPDAGAQPNVLTPECDTTVDGVNYAVVPASDLPGPFNAYECPGEYRLGDSTIECVASIAVESSPVQVDTEGRFWFRCRTRDAMLRIVR
jgi:hypothetical protein